MFYSPDTTTCVEKLQRVDLSQALLEPIILCFQRADLNLKRFGDKDSQNLPNHDAA